MNKIRSNVGITLVPNHRVAAGQRCERITVIGQPFYARLNRGLSEGVVVCECDCGTVFVSRAVDIGRGTQRTSCVRCSASERQKTHGDSRTRLYRIWSGMKCRCVAQTGLGAVYYSSRSISVCPEWATSYESFRSWAMSHGYSDELELDRRDGNGNYEPENCRWATREVQMHNTRKRRDAKTSRFRGVSWCANVSKWRAQINHLGQHMHIGVFATEAEAVEAYDTAAKRLYGEFANTNA